MGFPDGSDGKECPYNAGEPDLIPGLGRYLGEKMATHSSILPWRIPWTEELGRLQSMGLKESDKTEQLTLFTTRINKPKNTCLARKF